MTESGSVLPALPTLSCPACHSRAAGSISLGAQTLKQCQDCHMVYAPEYVDPEEIYVEGYHSGGLGAFGVDLSHPEWDEFLAFVGQRRIDMLEAVVKPPGRLVDVGCGPGHTLAEARRRGWDTIGIELVPSAAQSAVEHFGLDVRNSLLEDSGLPERSFDVVSATHVLEHMQDGLGFLKSIGRWVKPGGHLLIEVPNWNSLDRRGNQDTWYGYRPLEHLGHYTPKTLAATMRRIGFEPVATYTPFFMFHRQALGQVLRDLGLLKLKPLLLRNFLTVEGHQRDEIVRLPNAFMRHVLSGLESVGSRAKAGPVVVMVARAPL